MTVNKIASALCDSSFESCAKTIIPPWVDNADDGPAKEAWSAVQTLRRQRAELVEFWPHKQHQIDAEFNDAVMVLARGVYQKLFDVDEL